MQVQIDLAQPADDSAIRRLCRRESMPGNITLTYEREPSFTLGCQVTGNTYQVLVARDENNEVVGVACRSTRELYVNGKPQRFGYLGQLRVDRRFRGRWLVSRGFSLLKQLHEQDPVPAYLVSVVEGNDEAEGVLVRKRRKSFPVFQPVAEFQTLAISLGRVRAASQGQYQISFANSGMAGELAKFLRHYGPRRQFFPVLTESAIRDLTSLGLQVEDFCVARRKGQIVGGAALWDQTAYKQTVVQGYSGWLKAAVPFYNIGAPWIGRPGLPRPGSTLRGVYGAFVCVAEDGTDAFAGILRELYNRAVSRGFDYLLVGLDARDPLLAVAKKYPHVLYPSRLHLAAWPEGGELHEQLDDRAAYVDIATL